MSAELNENNQGENPESEESPSIIAHVSAGTNQLPEALAFYDKVLATVGAKRIVEVPGIGVAWGKIYPEFWVQKPHNQEAAEIANGVHFAFLAASPEEVDAFYATALECGARGDGEPGPRIEYSAAYYGCFVRDLDGHKIEAMYWDFSKAPVTHA